MNLLRDAQKIADATHQIWDDLAKLCKERDDKLVPIYRPKKVKALVNRYGRTKKMIDNLIADLQPVKKKKSPKPEQKAKAAPKKKAKAVPKPKMKTMVQNSRPTQRVAEKAETPAVKKEE